MQYNEDINDSNDDDHTQAQNTNNSEEQFEGHNPDEHHDYEDQDQNDDYNQDGINKSKRHCPSSLSSSGINHSVDIHLEEEKNCSDFKNYLSKKQQISSSLNHKYNNSNAIVRNNNQKQQQSDTNTDRELETNENESRKKNSDNESATTAVTGITEDDEELKRSKQVKPNKLDENNNNVNQLSFAEKGFRKLLLSKNLSSNNNMSSSSEENLRASTKYSNIEPQQQEHQLNEKYAEPIGVSNYDNISNSASNDDEMETHTSDLIEENSAVGNSNINSNNNNNHTIDADYSDEEDYLNYSNYSKVCLIYLINKNACNNFGFEKFIKEKFNPNVYLGSRNC
jgi:hypothetical protein